MGAFFYLKTANNFPSTRYAHPACSLAYLRLARPIRIYSEEYFGALPDWFRHTWRMATRELSAAVSRWRKRTAGSEGYMRRGHPARFGSLGFGESYLQS